ncbi:DUF2637 domain-containing protein [Streptomyces nigra]|uniref:DUF2637 domain-containing protein n=1 Tax=Streptomyces nigra TaxID=1827580 RepID=UPI003693D004
MTGALIIAGIGFAGSYGAVHKLAVLKGFGTFAYVLPIGIDAGICVLLSLDLLLTWIRIPFPLLRQTAWLLTAATIAFNGAAAWPDPLGVGMHAVIPILFIVTVEAARHAIGRIADITVDKHMEGVRLTRWLLSPVPTFLLWRRMKLWELRSYEKAIKLEQERLVYQAGLRSRFGRAWRRKAPVEALIRLRLIRYGIPLAETAQAGLAVAGIERPPSTFTLERATAAPETPGNDSHEIPTDLEDHQAQADKAALQSAAARPITTAGPPGQLEASAREAERFADAYQSFVTKFKVEPAPALWALWLRDTYGISTGSGNPLSEDKVQPLLNTLRRRYAPVATETAPEGFSKGGQSWEDYFHSAWQSFRREQGFFPHADRLAAYVYERDAITNRSGLPITGEDLAGFVTRFQERHQESASRAGQSHPPIASAPVLTTQAQEERQPERAALPAQTTKVRRPRVKAPVDDSRQPAIEGRTLTASDRYYLAWTEYQNRKGSEPSDEQLSAYCAEKGLLGRGNKPISPANLRRHFVRWRVYNVWAAQRMNTAKPAPADVAYACAERGITAQYNRPLTVEYVADEAVDFERRWQVLARYSADAQL